LLAGAAAGVLFAVHAALAPEQQLQFAQLLAAGGNILFVFGVIGIVSDLALRGLRNVTAKWARP